MLFVLHFLHPLPKREKRSLFLPVIYLHRLLSYYVAGGVENFPERTEEEIKIGGESIYGSSRSYEGKKKMPLTLICTRGHLSAAVGGFELSRANRGADHIYITLN